VLILLPPSEGKFSPTRGKPLNLDHLSHPELGPTRRHVLHALVDLCRGDADNARKVLGLSSGQADEVARNAGLRTAPTASAARIYTGVLYESLALDTLSAAANRRAATRVAITSSVFGLVRLADRIPSYRLNGSVNLPGLGTVAGVWRSALDEVLGHEAQRGLIVDLRSGTYAAFWRPARTLTDRVVTVRVVQEVRGLRTIVSHFNKATKGRIVASLLEAGANPASERALTTALMRLGWQVDADSGPPGTINVVVADPIS
jgi:cytoplasmic iron level regulating protein YaaA (DUF328/UPF0246 family)